MDTTTAKVRIISDNDMTFRGILEFFRGTERLCYYLTAGWRLYREDAETDTQNLIRQYNESQGENSLLIPSFE